MLSDGYSASTPNALACVTKLALVLQSQSGQHGCTT